MADNRDPGDGIDDPSREDSSRGEGDGAVAPPVTVSVSQTLRPDQTLRLESDALDRFRQRLNKQGSLLIIAGTPADVGNHLVVEQPVVIGREQGDLPLRDGRISRQHAAVALEGTRYVVRDLGSTNGTMLNGERLEGEHTLEDGDQILVGQTVIKFTLVDRTEARYMKQMERLVGTDDLTGLVAKHRFDGALHEALRVARLTRRPLSVMMMDMDGLKAINDAHGHHTGAGTIRQVGELIAGIMVGRGEACRFGGDEFSAYLPNIALAGARARAEQIRQVVEETDFGRAGQQINATISIGVAVLLPEVESAEALLELADRALYRAKGRGRNTVSD
jgi:diguanylate cyclase (GGDEF)-like protein